MMMSIKHDLAVETNIRIFEPQHIKAHHQFSPLQSSLNKVFIIKFLASTTKLQNLLCMSLMLYVTITC
jgi:hypothetical protein